MNLDLILCNRSTIVVPWDETYFAGSVSAFVLVANQQFLPCGWGLHIGIDHIEAHYVGKSESLADGTPYVVYLRDKSDQPGDLGYHIEGPQASVFLSDDLAYRSDPCVTWTHEAFEMVVDPKTTWVEQIGDVWLAVESCDPVEADADAIPTSVPEGQQFMVSNVVTPRYFGIDTSDGPFDLRESLAGPAPLLRPGGYQLVYRGGQWTQNTARLADGRMPPRALRNGRKAVRCLSAPRTSS